MNSSLDEILKSMIVLVLNEFMEKERDDYLTLTSGGGCTNSKVGAYWQLTCDKLVKKNATQVNEVNVRVDVVLLEWELHSVNFNL